MDDLEERADFPRALPHDAILEGKLENVKWLVDALSCIYSSAHKGQDVKIRLHSEGGLRFLVQHTGVLQASVIIPAVAFSSFRAVDDSIQMMVNLSLLMECLNLFAAGVSATPVSAHIWYGGEGSPLFIRLWDGDADTVCELKTLAIDDDNDYDGHGGNIALAAGVDLRLTLDLGFYNYEVVTAVVMNSDALRDALSELDYCGATTAEIRLAPVAPRFTLSSPAASIASINLDGLGEEALCTVELPEPTDRNIEMFQSFQCKRTQCSVYKLQHLARCRQGLGSSETCKVQMNAEGMLSIVCRMKGLGDGLAEGRGRIGAADRCFVEFVIVAQEIDEDDDEGDPDGVEHVTATAHVGDPRRLTPVVGGVEIEEAEHEDEDEDDEVPATPPERG